MPVPLGEHFLDRTKLWSLVAAGKTVPLVDLAYSRDAYSGFDVETGVARLADDCALLVSQGVTPLPYLRLDFRPGETMRDDPVYYRAVVECWRLWNRPEQLTLICGNEPNHPQEGPVSLAVVEGVMHQVVTLRDILVPRCRVFAPAIAPWAPVNVDDPADFYDPYLPPARTGSTQWENQQFGLARRLADVPIDGYAMHAYGRPVDTSDADEPLRFDPAQPNYGFAVLRDMTAAIRCIDTRGLPVAVTETNTYIGGEPSSVTYPDGWLQAAMQVTTDQGCESLCWFVGEPHGENWANESLKLRIQQCAVADDNFNTILLS